MVEGRGELAHLVARVDVGAGVVATLGEGAGGLRELLDRLAQAAREKESEAGDEECRHGGPEERVEAYPVRGAESGRGGLGDDDRPADSADGGGRSEPFAAVGAGHHAGDGLLGGSRRAQQRKLRGGEPLARVEPGDGRAVRRRDVGDLLVVRDAPHPVIHLGQRQVRIFPIKHDVVRPGPFRRGEGERHLRQGPAN